MPKKGNKATRRSGQKNQNNAPQAKDDGTRWIVVKDDEQVYGGSGTTREEAMRLAHGLLNPGQIKQVE